MKKIFSTLGHASDTTLFIVILVLICGGFLFLSSASSDVAKIKYDDSYFFLKNQILKGFLPGLLGLVVGYLIYYRRWKRMSVILLGLNIVLLILVFTPLGYAAKGSHRWIELGPLSFQPSEFLKITFILYLANLLSSSALKKSKHTWQTYFLFLGVSLVIGLLIFIQPATTMAIIILGAGTIMYFFNGATFRQVILSGAVLCVIVGALVVATPYRFSRIMPFWNSVANRVAPSLVNESEQGDTFHVNQSLIAIGTGGVSGVGFGQSTSKYSVLPEPMGDSIFSVIAEEFGFVGSCIVLALYILLFWRMTDAIQRSHDDFARLVLLGFASVISIQTLIHIAANSGIFPYTGVPLPFISYGGTALAVFMTMMGIALNITRHTSRLKTM